MLARLMLGAIRFYRAAVSPYTPASCRYYPTCSAYALEAVERWGAARGAWLALRRLARCHPLRAGGIDPVPGKPAPRSIPDSLNSGPADVAGH